MYQRIQQQAGFIEFAEGNFSEASDLFHTSKLDVREVSYKMRGFGRNAYFFLWSFDSLLLCKYNAM